MATRRNRLREVRREQGIAQVALHAKAGVSASTISAIELHGLYPGEETRKRIVRTLGVEESEIWPKPGQE